MKYTPEQIVKAGLSFTIPLYQRLFEWNADNINQLLSDLYIAYEKYKELSNHSDEKDEKYDYYIGMLTATESDSSFVLVDGQQRFSVMMLFGCVMQIYCKEKWGAFLSINKSPRLSFISRYSDEQYLSKLIDKDFEYKGEFVNWKMKVAVDLIKGFMDGIGDDAVPFSSFVYEHLCFFISRLPQQYSPQDLNKYFERMNSSGKNLEHHEILKVKLLSKLDGNTSLYMQIWNKIADVDTVLIRKRDYKNEKQSDYYERKNKLLSYNIEEIVNNPSIINGLQEQHPETDSSIEKSKTIDEIAASDKKPQESSHYNNGSRCVIRFPHLLLQTLYYFIKNKNVVINSIEDFFDQRNLLETFKTYLPYEGANVNKEDIKSFFELLIHCRLIIDVCFVRSMEYGYSLDMNVSEDNNELKQLMMFESFLYVSSSNVTNYRWFGWLMDYVMKRNCIPCSTELFEELKQKCDNNNPLPDYDDLNFKKEIRYWFWRLDFYIWQHRKDLFSRDENEDVYLRIADNYVFIRNRSIEHIAPQQPKKESDLKWEDNEEDTKLRNSFGNLVMISQGLNSALSNSSYEEKKAHVESYFKSVNGTIESLKLLMVYKDWKIAWDKASIPIHGRKMYELLKSEIPLKQQY